MKKLNNTKQYRYDYGFLRQSIMRDIKEILKDYAENELDLYDDRGSLIYGGDEQEPQMILSIYLKYAKDKDGDQGKVIARIGVYDEDYQVPLDEMNIEMLLNIMEAVEKEENERP